MKTSSFYTLIYGIIILVGGLMGYSAGSKASLIAGGLFGVLLIGCAFIMKRYIYAEYFAVLLAFILTLFFGYRFSQTISFQGGALTLLSAFVTTVLLTRVFKFTSCD